MKPVHEIHGFPAAALLVLLLVSLPVAEAGEQRAGKELAGATQAVELVADAEVREAWLLGGDARLADGAPATGAVVVTSAGGMAVVDEQGRYELEVLVPRDSRALHLLATLSRGAETFSATREVLGGVANPLGLEPLVLTASSAGCTPEWLPTFGGLKGLNGHVCALASYDDGSGPALYVGGVFGGAGGHLATRIARWDGSGWSTVGAGLGGAVRAFAVFGHGTGPALFVGGDFTGGLAKWEAAA